MYTILVDEAMRWLKSSVSLYEDDVISALQTLSAHHPVYFHATPIFERDFTLSGIHIVPHKVVAKRIVQASDAPVPGMLIALDEVIAQHAFLNGPCFVAGSLCVSGNLVLESHGQWGLFVERDLRVDTLIELDHTIEVEGEITCRRAYRRGDDPHVFSAELVCNFDGTLYPDYERVIDRALQGRDVLVGR